MIKKIFTAFGMGLLIVTGVGVLRADAISDTFPTNVSPMADKVAVVARTGGGYELDAPQAFFKVFAFSPNVSVVVEDICFSYDWGNASAIVQVFPNDANENAKDANPATAFIDPQAQFSTASCAGFSDVTMNISGAEFSTVLGHEAYHTFTIVVQHTGASGGINGFGLDLQSAGYITFREQAVGEAIASGAFPSYRPFAVLDQVFGGDPHDEDAYVFNFGTDCSITAPTTAFLRWSDADYGRTNEWGVAQGRQDVSFQLVDSSGNLVPLEITISGTPFTKTTLSGEDLNFAGNDNEPREASFTTQPDEKYTWRWSGVDNINGVQIWMPFSEINSIINCPVPPPPPPATSCTPVSTATGGSAGCTESVPGYSNTNARQCVNAITSATNGTWTSADCTGGTFASQSATDTATGTIAFRYEIYTQTTTIPSFCGYDLSSGFAVLISPCPPVTSWVSTGTFGTTPASTVTIKACKWQYDHSSALNGGSPSNTNPKPGGVIRLSATLFNDVGDSSAGDGPNHQVCMYPKDNTAGEDSAIYLENSGTPTGESSGCTVSGRQVICTGSGIDDDDDASYWGEWTVDLGARHRAEICFAIESSPSRGDSYPSVTVTDSGPNQTPPFARCILVYNLRYDISAPQVTISNSNPSEGIYVYPGDTVSVTVNVCNDEFFRIPPGTRGNAPGIQITTSGDFGSIGSIDGTIDINSSNNQQIVSNSGICSPDRTATVTVPTSATVGSRLCVVATSNRNHGYSDGTGLGGGSVSSNGSDCVIVKNGPYLKVFGNDIWAGANFASSGAPYTCSGAADPATAHISSNTRLYSGGWYGAAVDFMETAVGLIRNFGSQNNPGSLGLARANTTGGGEFGLNTRCIPYYPDMLTIDDGGGASINQIVNASNNGDQQILSGNQTFTSNAANPFTKRLTVVIDGNLEIGRNITYANVYPAGQVPILTLIVTGDVTIRNNVTNVDAVIISYGTIATCETASDLSTSVCNNPLKIGGSLIAREIYLRRTAGGINEASTGVNSGSCSNVGSNRDQRCAGEIIDFHPANYLAKPVFKTGTPPTVDFETQQIKDLPPIR